MQRQPREQNSSALTGIRRNESAPEMQQQTRVFEFHPEGSTASGGALRFDVTEVKHLANFDTKIALARVGGLAATFCCI